MKTLILGGARSGKSRLAQQIALQAEVRLPQAQVVMLATAQALDAEMTARIEVHRRARPARWLTVEAPYDLARTLRDHDGVGRVIIVDCLTLWLTQLLTRASDAAVTSDAAALAPTAALTDLPEVTELLELVPKLACELLLVSNETGWGVVPQGALTRRFVDESGRLHQRLALMCERVLLTVAGLPLVLKGTL